MVSTLAACSPDQGSDNDSGGSSASGGAASHEGSGGGSSGGGPLGTGGRWGDGEAGAAGDAAGGAGVGGSAGGGHGGTAAGGATPRWLDNSSPRGLITLFAPLRPGTGNLAAMFSSPELPVLSRCDSFTEGSCTYSECPEPSYDLPADRVPDAGTLLLEGVDVDFRAALEPELDGTYETLSPLPARQAYLGGGELVRLSSSGAEVPAFAAAFEWPLVLLLQHPETSNGSFAIRRDADLVLRWTRAQPNVFFSFLAQASDSGRGLNVDCTVDSAAAELVVPAAMLNRMPGDAAIALVTSQDNQLRSGSFDIRVRLVTEVRDPEKLHWIRPTFSSP